MKHERQTQFGRPMSAVQTSDLTLVDKWQVLRDLSDAAETLGLNHRTLGVLRALLTFHPERHIGPEPLSAVVFPSNKTLSHRLNGMPESTLRRHLNQLVACGVVIRHDSANRKRFKRRAGVAFGFDLAPLAQNITYIANVADTARDRRDRLANLRDQAAQHRQELFQSYGPCHLTEEARAILRRKPEETVLQELINKLTDRLSALEAIKMNGADSQNERHIHSESLNNSDQCHQKKENTQITKDPELAEILDQCIEYKLYYPQPVRSWQDAFGIASRLSDMMGIDQSVFHDAVTSIGKKRCVVTIFELLDKLPLIENPGGYLRRISQNTGFHASICL